MKRLLLPLLAALALPTVVNAETWWLMAGGRWEGKDRSTSNQWSIPTNSEKECEQAGQKFLNTKFPSGFIDDNKKGYACVKGK